MERGTFWRTRVIGWLGIWVPATVLALDFSIPGRIEVFRDVPKDGEEPIDQVVAMDRPGAEGHYLVHDSSGGIACVPKDRRERIPVWPGGQPGLGMQPPFVAADSDAVYSDQRYYRGSDYNRDGFDVFRFRCDQRTRSGTSSYVDPSRIRLAYDPGFTDREPVGPMIAWDRKVCVVSREAVGCASLDDPQPTLRTLVTAREVAAGIAHPPFYDVPDWTWSTGIQYTFQDLFPGEYSFAGQPWGFQQAVALPDGRMAMLIRSEFQGPLAARAAYLLRLAPDGRIEEVLHGPSTEWRLSSDWLQERTNRRHPLLEVTGMAWDAGEGVIWLWPWSAWDWARQKAFVSDGAGNGSIVQGFAGTGALGLRPDRPGIFYLPLSAALVDSPYERIRTDRNQANRVPDLLRFIPLGASRARIEISRPTTHGFVRWVPETLDRDQDGLTAAEEERLGTDDWIWDSDGDGLSDGVEAGLGLHPGIDEGYLANRAFDRGGAGFAESPWFATFRLPEAMPRWTGEKSFAENPGMQGPFCIGRTCHFPDGTSMTLSHEAAAVSMDGRWVIDRGGSVRTDLRTGATAPWMASPFDWERTGLAWYVEDADSAYVVVAPGNVAYTQVVHVDGAGWSRVLLEAGLDPTGQVADYPLAHRGASMLWPVGFHLESRKVLVAAQGAWETWLLAVSADRPPALLERAQGITRQNRHRDQGSYGTAWGPLLEGSFPNGFPFPLFLHANGHGDYFSDRWIYGTWLEDGRIGAVRDFLGADFLYQMRLVGGFGDVLLDAQTGSEIVTIPRRVDPGDVLALGEIPGEGTMLFRVGPRGGLATLWPSPRKGFGFRGMGASAGGRVCFAGEPGDACPEGCVAEFSPSEESRIPDVLTGIVGGRGYRDCAYEDEDTLVLWRVVAGAPPGEESRVERWRRQGADFAKVDEWPAGPASFQGFVEGPEGPSLFPDDQAVVARLDDGRTVRFSVASGDPLVTRMEEALGFRGVSVLDAVARPDGFVIVLVSMPGSGSYPEGTYLAAYRPDQDRFARVLRYGGSEGIAAIARVPGGIARDPWPGPAAGSGGEDSPGGTTSVDPLGPLPPSFALGEEVPGSGGGCGARPGPVPPVAVLFLLPLVSRRIRRVAVRDSKSPR